MNLPNEPRFSEQQSRFSRPAPRCERGGPVRKIDDVLAELLGQYRTRFPDLRMNVIEMPASVY